MKGQMGIILVFMLLIIGGVLAVVLYKAGSSTEAIETIEYHSFVNSLENHISVINKRPIGSRDRFSLAMPPTIRQVCFSANDDVYDLYSFPEVEAQKNFDIGATVFFEPREVFVPLQIKGFSTINNPLCVSVEKNKLNLNLESKGGSVEISAVTEQDVVPSSCGSLIYKGEDKLDLVFLNYGYETVSEFRSDVGRYFDGIFLDLEPYASYTDAYNVYVVDEEVDVCSISYLPTQYIKCDVTQLHKVAASCPHDYVFLLADINRLAGGEFIRSSSIGNLLKVNTADSSMLVVAHEFGHGFGKLTDEYVDSATYSRRVDVVENSPNCAEVPCDKWSGIAGTGCYPGCSLSSYNSPTENSIMGYYTRAGGDVYGPVNEKVLRDKLEVYS